MSKTIRSTLLAACLAATATPLLQGCFPAAAVGMGAGALIIADRRNSETYLADEAIEIRTLNRIGEKFGERVHVNVTSYNMKLLLTGEAPNSALKAEIEQLAGGVPNVKAIANEIQVAGISGYAARSNDIYITSKVKARFIEAGKFSANHIKVVTEAGVVYLLGLITRREADDAAEIARTTAGVLKVIRMFEYLRDEEARHLDARLPQEAKPPQS